MVRDEFSVLAACDLPSQTQASARSAEPRGGLTLDPFAKLAEYHGDHHRRAVDFELTVRVSGFFPFGKQSVVGSL